MSHPTASFLCVFKSIWRIKMAPRLTFMNKVHKK